jgi:hypothetical protein
MEQRADTVSLLQQAVADGTFAMAMLEIYIITRDETVIPDVRSSLANAVENLERAQAHEQTNEHGKQAASLSEFIAGAAFASEIAEQFIALRQSGHDYLVYRLPFAQTVAAQQPLPHKTTLLVAADGSQVVLIDV